MAISSFYSLWVKWETILVKMEDKVNIILKTVFEHGLILVIKVRLILTSF